MADYGAGKKKLAPGEIPVAPMSDVERRLRGTIKTPAKPAAKPAAKKPAGAKPESPGFFQRIKMQLSPEPRMQKERGLK